MPVMDPLLIALVFIAEQTSSRPDSEASEPAVTAESNTQVLGDVVPDDNPQPCSVDSISNSFGVHAEQTSRRPDLEASGPAVTAESNTQVLGDVVPDDNSHSHVVLIPLLIALVFIQNKPPGNLIVNPLNLL